MSPDTNILAWLHVHIPKRWGLSRFMWRFIIPTVCREAVERACKAAYENPLRNYVAPIAGEIALPGKAWTNLGGEAE